MTTVRIKSMLSQKLDQKIKSEILDEFWDQYANWKADGQKNISGDYRLAIYEEIEFTGNYDDDSISISIEKYGEYDMEDGGYMQVFGLREIEDRYSYGEIMQLKNLQRIGCIK